MTCGEGKGLAWTHSSAAAEPQWLPGAPTPHACFSTAPCCWPKASSPKKWCRHRLILARLMIYFWIPDFGGIFQTCKHKKSIPQTTLAFYFILVFPLWPVSVDPPGLTLGPFLVPTGSSPGCLLEWGAFLLGFIPASFPSTGRAREPHQYHCQEARLPLQATAVAAFRRLNLQLLPQGKNSRHSNATIQQESNRYSILVNFSTWILQLKAMTTNKELKFSTHEKYGRPPASCKITLDVTGEIEQD